MCGVQPGFLDTGNIVLEQEVQTDCRSEYKPSDFYPILHLPDGFLQKSI
jgi:hypothetical protein